MKNETSQDKLTILTESINSKLNMLSFQANWIYLSTGLIFFMTQLLLLFSDLDASLNNHLILLKISIVISEIILAIWIIRYFKLKKDAQMKSIKIKAEYDNEILLLLIVPTFMVIKTLLA